MKQEAINKLLEVTEKEIIQGEIMIAFYEERAKKQEPEEAAKTLLKAEQLRSTLKFNNEFNEYLKSL
ncbi:MAG: hypothetical protein LC127_07525 [Chitinophagales bacterium]|nr:hypothetical protein [Chitinophagales bacterium]